MPEMGNERVTASPLHGFRYLLKAQNMVGRIAENEYYISNIAVYPEFRGLGLGTKLLSIIEREARETGNKRIILDVETSNERAVKLYERLGYIVERGTPSFKINKEAFKFFRMCKFLEHDGNFV
jgi:ribosomal protein S18 acetylase RimI-like enzyme